MEKAGMDKDGWKYDTALNYDYAKNEGLAKERLNGKVVARFWCDNVHDIEVEENDSNGNYSDTYIYCDIPDLEDQSCLEFDDIVEYLWNYDKWGGKGYAIHISKVEVFDKPMLLTMFRKPEFHKNIYDNNGIRLSLFKRLKKYSISKAPQSWCYVED